MCLKTLSSKIFSCALSPPRFFGVRWCLFRPRYVALSKGVLFTIGLSLSRQKFGDSTGDSFIDVRRKDIHKDESTNCQRDNCSCQKSLSELFHITSIKKMERSGDSFSPSAVWLVGGVLVNSLVR
jgi:hypothetical protein